MIRRLLRLAVLAAFAASIIAQPAVAAERLAAMKAAGSLRICIWPDYHGISYRNPHSGELAGIDITLSAAFAADLGLQPVYVDTHFGRFTADLLDDRCDIAMFGVATLPERMKQVRFSAPYLHSDLFAVTTLGNPRIRQWTDIDRPGHVVAVQKGTYMEPAMQRLLRHAELRVVQPPRTREHEVLAGRADVFITDYPYAQDVRRRHDWARVVAPDRPVHPITYAYAVAPGDDAWLQRVNRFVADIKRDGRLMDAARHAGLSAVVIRE